MKKLRILVIAVLCVSVHATSDDERARIKNFMHNFVVEFAKMSPYMNSEEAFSSDKGKSVVIESITNLQKLTAKAPPQAYKKNPGFRISYGLLGDHVTKAKEAFDAGEFEQARMRVNSVGGMCAACHMQAPSISRFKAFEFVVERTEGASFTNANFLFVIRRYDEALKMLNQLIRSYPKEGMTADQLTEGYRQKLGILARVYRNPIAAEKSLKEDLNNKQIPLDVRRNVLAWIEVLGKWKNESADPAKLKTKELIDFVAKELPIGMTRKIAPSDPAQVGLLRMSGLLYERLYKEPAGPHTQELLYYLARAERSLAPHYWYSLNEIYLKECVVQYPKQAFSKKCFEAYEDGMRERYFGKPLPIGVRQGIEALKEYL